jgi:toxin CcdB
VVTAKQFDVCRVTGLRAESPIDLAVVMQDDTLSHLATRVVAPLVPVSNGFVVDRTTPMVEIDGVRYAVAIHLLMTIPARNLGTLVASLEDHDRALKGAIDMAFFGI